MHGTCNHSPNGLQKVIQKSKNWKNTTSKLKLLCRFRGLGGLGVCGNHRKLLQLRACQLWCKSVRKTNISCFLFLSLFTFRALGVESPRGGAIIQLFTLKFIETSKASIYSQKHTQNTQIHFQFSQFSPKSIFANVKHSKTS